MSAIIFVVTPASNRSTFIRVGFSNWNLTFIPVTFMFMVKMTIVYIINMVVVSNFCMSTSDTMTVIYDFLYG
ncbi:hypothetical protein [Peribacillus frigoritolerans]|uniref:hypothetical protein n=1 Tax=Peribacillus frigoritolerans TaxID=450367 RepID=UPI0024C1119F|nr:hypothetical protein [Peribacillus frigoritolerans]WHX59998.1 hypothetical protein QNH33_15230 [Peribacillus frigoritolerans]